VLRFSCFLHVQEQLHYNFTNHVGFYVLRNVGFINDLNDTVKLKQRVLYTGIAGRYKLGNMSSSTYATIGVEGELAFHYKQRCLLMMKVAYVYLV
jgi:hypothetical protein